MTGVTKAQRQALRKLDDARADHKLGKLALAGGILIVLLWVGGWITLITVTALTAGHIDMMGWWFGYTIGSVALAPALGVVVWSAGEHWVDTRQALRHATYAYEDSLLDANRW